MNMNQGTFRMFTKRKLNKMNVPMFIRQISLIIIMTREILRELSELYLLFDIVSYASGIDAEFFPTHRTYTMEGIRSIVHINSIRCPCGVRNPVHIRCIFNQEDRLTSSTGTPQIPSREVTATYDYHKEHSFYSDIH